MRTKSSFRRRLARGFVVSVWLWALLASSAAADHAAVSEAYPVTESVTGSQVDPAVGWDGENVLVAWLSHGECEEASERRLHAARLSTSGEILDPEPIVLDECGGHEDVRVASSGDGFLVVWRRPSSSASEVRAIFVSGDGTVEQSGGMLVAPDASDPPAVAASDNGFLVAWVESGDLSHRTPSASIHLPVSSLTVRLTVGLAAAHRTSVIEATRLGADGGPLDDESFPVLLEARHPAIAWNGTEYLVVGATTGRTSLGGPAVSIGGPGCFPLVPCGIGPGGLGVEAEAEVVGARVTPEGVVLDPVPIPVSPGAHAVRPVGGCAYYSLLQCPSPTVASDGTDFLVVWRANSCFLGCNPGGDHQIVGARVNHAGAPLDPVGIPVSPWTFWVDRPAVAWNGVGYTVLWTRGPEGSLEGATVDAEGEIHGPSAIAPFPGELARSLRARAAAGPAGHVAFTYSRYSRAWLRFVSEPALP